MIPDVLTLEEVAEYLRVSQDIVEFQALRGRGDTIITATS